ncbi:MAG: hypothetical protein KBD63_01020 [Bacteriovoracaceae bacterium]|nr:hypothetical protein [Bacteriovoracaceae bacterium]
MEVRMQGLTLEKNFFRLVDIFGYSSQGLPGLEIVGLGAQGKNMKEKFIFIAKEKKMKIPLKRYVLCVDQEITHHAWLEIPLLLSFWFLSGHLQLKTMHNCLAFGQVSVKGEFIEPVLSLEERQKIFSLASTNTVYLSQHKSEFFHQLDLKDFVQELA